MEETNNIFPAKLNAFTELLKSTQKSHVTHLLQMVDWQKSLKNTHQTLLKLLNQPDIPTALADNKELQNLIPDYKQEVLDFEESAKAFRVLFNQHINDTNYQLGMFSSHWGSYIESLGVQYMLNYLRKHHGVHTSFQKYKRFWHKTRNVEIDLLALSDTHAYVIEVKTQLKPETFTQLQKIIDKLGAQVPEYAQLQLQPVIVCVHADESTLASAALKGIWVVRYKGFDRPNAIDGFEWLNTALHS
ncbi:hypothetical protein FBD94_20245 [Pedobacter hiemivivus]|uniref:DUF8196 domain-containing protein n=1 Tax=Pedobacter hiemivivus TaxID=2530454 RepID=A0A4U1G9C9_9SPHI|nr:DUF234 domain-containing protein [Pedobacter hiemivivus]TKC57612.1 hypothetical protein FBD94_20245 [Pedobacter hiemivivus]